MSKRNLRALYVYIIFVLDNSKYLFEATLWATLISL